jgi:hypothetical protein
VKRVVLAAFALGATALAGPTAAGAAAPDVIHGGCGFNTDEQATLTGGQNVGVIYDLSVTTTGDVPPLPIDATVTCWIEVNGVEAPHTRYSYSGPGVQAGADRISFAAGDTDTVWECESVTFADGTTQVMDCPTPIPPAEVPPVVGLLDAVNTVFVSYVDPVVCPVLAATAGTYGPITIAPDGDVYVPDPLALGLSPIYDCPPYVIY